MRSRGSRPLLAVAILVLLTSVVLEASDGLDLSWWTIDGGGGTSQGGDYSLTGTAGQPDAGTAMRGGTYALAGGCWAAGGGGGVEHDVYLPLVLRMAH